MSSSPRHGARQALNCANCACRAVAQNSVTLRLLGLCPLLAVSSTASRALCLALLFAVVVIGSALVTAAFRQCVSWRLQPVYHALVASFVTSVAIGLGSIADFEAVAALGIYAALIAGNCLVVSVIQESVERERFSAAWPVVLKDLVSVCTLLTVFGSLRELLAFGSVFKITSESVDLPPRFFALAETPAGALLLFALVLAAANVFARRRTTSTTTMLDEASVVSHHRERSS